jgi:hypothetical protein
LSKRNIKKIVESNGIESFSSFGNDVFKVLWNDGTIGNNVWDYDLWPLMGVLKGYYGKVINGKIHITSNLTFKHLPKEQIKQYVFNDLNSIVGIEKTAYQIKTWKTYHPYYCITYKINSEIHTKVGCIYKVKA